jgi:hypothetical protein
MSDLQAKRILEIEAKLEEKVSYPVHFQLGCDLATQDNDPGFTQPKEPVVGLLSPRGVTVLNDDKSAISCFPP